MPVTVERVEQQQRIQIQLRRLQIFYGAVQSK
jgi:hypothetical protein